MTPQSNHRDTFFFIYLVTYTQGVLSRGMKNPLVNPATLDMIGDSRKARSGTAQRRNVRIPTHAWFSAMATTTN